MLPALLAWSRSLQPACLARSPAPPRPLPCPSPFALLSDFNLSRLLEDTGATRSSASTAGGLLNPRWLAPEVLIGGSATAASDVFSFGVVLWELVRAPAASCAGGGSLLGSNVLCSACLPMSLRTAFPLSPSPQLTWQLPWEGRNAFQVRRLVSGCLPGCLPGCLQGSATACACPSPTLAHPSPACPPPTAAPPQLVFSVSKGERLVVPPREELPGVPMDAELYALYTALLRRCWAQEPADRPTFADVIADLRCVRAQRGWRAWGQRRMREHS